MKNDIRKTLAALLLLGLLSGCAGNAGNALIADASNDASNDVQRVDVRPSDTTMSEPIPDMHQPDVNQSDMVKTDVDMLDTTMSEPIQDTNMSDTTQTGPCTLYPNTGCPTNQTCRTSLHTCMSECEPYGTVQEGSDCTRTFDCAAGLGCYLKCYQRCNTTSDCLNGKKCEFFSPTGCPNVSVGVCKGI